MSGITWTVPSENDEPHIFAAVDAQDDGMVLLEVTRGGTEQHEMTQIEAVELAAALLKAAAHIAAGADQGP